MLSRIAESLYWIGRYVERAEDTSRLLEVYLQLLVEDPSVDTRLSTVTMFAVLGMEPPAGPVSSQEVLRTIQNHPTAACSILASLGGGRESARRARETVPPEMWESLNTTWNSVRTDELRRRRPLAALAFVRDRCVLISGIADTTMSHDEGWQFLQLGRQLERVDMMARLLLWVSANRRSMSAWNNALRASGALHAYRRTHGAATLGHDAAEFLLLDRLFPRSVVHSLSRAEEALAELEPGSRRSGFPSEGLRLLGRARAELEYQSLSEVLTDLPDRLRQLQQVCVDVDAAIAHRYFVGSLAPVWSGGVA